MNEFFQIVLYSLFAGITIFLGGFLANLAEKNLKKEIESHILHWSVAFGGGILVAAVAFVLTPKGIEIFPIHYLAFIFLSGAVTFFIIDKYIENK